MMLLSQNNPQRLAAQQPHPGHHDNAEPTSTCPTPVSICLQGGLQVLAAESKVGKHHQQLRDDGDGDVGIDGDFS
jgi:hypothetical protein